MKITKKIHNNGYITFKLNVKDNLHGTINLSGYVNDLRKKYKNDSINVDLFEDSIFGRFFVFKGIHDQNKVNEYNKKNEQIAEQNKNFDLSSIFD